MCKLIMEYRFFDVLKSCYTKNPLDIKIDTNYCIGLVRWLSYDPINLPIIKRITKYLFYLKPLYFYYMLLLCIPPRKKIPFLNKPSSEPAIKYPKLYEEIRKALDWSDKELRLHSKLLNRVIDKNHWKKEMALK